MLTHTEQIDQYKQLTSVDVDLQELFERHKSSVEAAILIREVEEAFLRLFAEGRMNGTVHTCVGQEFSAVTVAGQLGKEDWITSNHRCHGHFIAKTGDWKGLIDELMGFESGVCFGVGSSQHLFRPGFLSNGPQGSLVPVATGIALHHRLKRRGNIAVSFIGEGTLGQGNIYEAMNLASCFQAPQLFVCENNLYSQSTPQAGVVSGDIKLRAEAFGLKTFESTTWDLDDLTETANTAIDYVRQENRPAFLLIKTYRLNAHSKGDDDRSRDEVDFFNDRDTLTRLLQLPEAREIQEEKLRMVTEHIDSANPAYLSLERYLDDQLPAPKTGSRETVRNERQRTNLALNTAYRNQLDAGGFMLGEDIEDPYGGAFKVTQGLSTDFPDNVITTPISEEGITGLGIGLSMMGTPTYVEIMFGDFLTHTFDQVISNASKFHHMYAFQASAPVRLRTPMGGKRGYGPTHSQSLEKHFLGIDNFAVVALTSLIDPSAVLDELRNHSCPALIVENKLDYSRFLWQSPEFLTTELLGGGLGTILISPVGAKPTCTLVAYGGMARELADSLDDVFVESDEICELVVPVSLHPLDIAPIKESVAQTGKLIVVEEGAKPYGFGAELLARLQESGCDEITVARVGAASVPVPSVASLENEVLPTVDSVIAALSEMSERQS